jgi:four helix bundle protein
MKRELPAVQTAYDLAKELLGRVAKFPKDHKFTLGDRMVNNGLAILENLVRAAYSKDKARLLAEADLHLEQLRFLLRLSRDLGPLSNQGYEFVTATVAELGNQIGGWRKQVAGKRGPDL